MLVRIVVLVSLIVVAANSADAQGPQTPEPWAARVEGYLGVGYADLDFDDDAGFTGGGAGSGVFIWGPAYLQADVFGDYTDIFDLGVRNVGGGGHVGVVDPELGAIGIAGAYQNFDLDGADVDIARVGGEAEAYVDALTFGIQAGYLRNATDDLDGYYARGMLRVYPLEDLKLEVVGGVGDIADTVGLARALIEYRPAGWPVGFFVRWEGAFSDSSDQAFGVVGIRLYLDSVTSLRETDRVYFRESCVNFNAGARTC